MTRPRAAAMISRRAAASAGRGQPQYGEPEMARQGERRFHLPLEGRSAVVRPPGGGIFGAATRRFASTSPEGGGNRSGESRHAHQPGQDALQRLEIV
ncbi:hypothetical protein [Allomesorhizobium alhagi]|uniref:hypothetical protein n=1 Tax=Allomesorhizobium alhagi TaxID=475067 RepID=UPI001111EDD3|nr:hypothetical protein [Mesorhizobium alhagi]